MLNVFEQKCCEQAIDSITKLVEEVTKLRKAVEKCIGYAIPPVQEAPVKEEHPTDSPFECLAVTKVEVFPFKDGYSGMGHKKGLASIVLNDQLMIHALRIMEGENGLFVGYPNDPFYKGEDFRSVCFPITRQLREHIENCVLEKYMEATK